MDRVVYLALGLSYAGRLPLIVAIDDFRADMLCKMSGHLTAVISVGEQTRGIQYDTVLLDTDVLETIDEVGLAWLSKIYLETIS